MIQEGLLWFDDTATRPLADKVALAAQRYQQKYGHVPEVCYVHPDELKGQNASADTVKVLPAKMVLPHHFWLGVEIKSSKGRAAAK